VVVRAAGLRACRVTPCANSAPAWLLRWLWSLSALCDCAVRGPRPVSAVVRRPAKDVNEARARARVCARVDVRKVQGGRVRRRACRPRRCRRARYVARAREAVAENVGQRSPRRERRLARCGAPPLRRIFSARRSVAGLRWSREGEREAPLSLPCGERVRENLLTNNTDARQGGRERYERDG